MYFFLLLSRISLVESQIFFPVFFCLSRHVFLYHLSPLTLFICGAADRSGRGKRSSSSSSSCWGGGEFFSLPCTVFWGVKMQKLCLKRGVKRQKTLSKILFSTPQISESIPFLFLGGGEAGTAELTFCLLKGRCCSHFVHLPRGVPKKSCCCNWQKKPFYCSSSWRWKRRQGWPKQLDPVNVYGRGRRRRNSNLFSFLFLVTMWEAECSAHAQ